MENVFFYSIADEKSIGAIKYTLSAILSYNRLIMNIDWVHFTPWSSALGGLLIGLARLFYYCLMVVLRVLMGF